MLSSRCIISHFENKIHCFKCLLFLHLSDIEVSTLIDVFSRRCDFYVQGSSGEFSSSEFESSEDCRNSSWVITAPLNHTIRLKFETFQLSDSQEYGQNWIRIYDGLKTRDTLLGVFTGARRPFIIQSSGRFMLVKLTKQSWYSLGNFKGVYTFNTTKGKFPIIYPLHTDSSKKIKGCRFPIFFIVSNIKEKLFYPGYPYSLKLLSLHTMLQ